VRVTNLTRVNDTARPHSQVPGPCPRRLAARCRAAITASRTQPLRDCCALPAPIQSCSDPPPQNRFALHSRTHNFAIPALRAFCVLDPREGGVRVLRGSCLLDSSHAHHSGCPVGKAHCGYAGPLEPQLC